MYFLMLKELFQVVERFAAFAEEALVLLTTYSILHYVWELVLEDVLDGFVFVSSLDEGGVELYGLLEVGGLLFLHGAARTV